MDYPLSNAEFKQIYSKVPRLCIDLIIKNDDKILLSKRKLQSWQNQWHLPGGTVYYKEFVQDAIKRIAKKELGVEVHSDKFLGYIEYVSEERERGFGWTVSLVFLCRIVVGVPKENEEGLPQFFSSMPNPMIKEQVKFMREKGLI